MKRAAQRSAPLGRLGHGPPGRRCRWTLDSGAPKADNLKWRGQQIQVAHSRQAHGGADEGRGSMIALSVVERAPSVLVAAGWWGTGRGTYVSVPCSGVP